MRLCSCLSVRLFHFRICSYSCTCGRKQQSRSLELYCHEVVNAALTLFMYARKALQPSTEHDEATVAVTTTSPEP